jgi:hypothetical protein
MSTLKRWVLTAWHWTWGSDYRTWGVHFVFALLLAGVLGLPGAALVVGFYVAHEQLDEELYLWLANDTPWVNWWDRDRAGDLVSAGLGVVAGLFLR